MPLGEGWEYSVVPGSPGAPPRAPWDEAMGLTSIYNGMIAPLRDYGVTGVAWYQGEADVGLPGSYADRLAAMMAGWRRQLGRPDLPFLIVSLANFGPHATTPVASGWAELREQQRLRRRPRSPRRRWSSPWTLASASTSIPPTSRRSAAASPAPRGASLTARAEPVGPELGPRARRDGRRRSSLDFTGVTGALRSWSGTARSPSSCAPRPRQSCRFADAVADGTHVRIADDGRPATRVRYGWADSPVTNLYDEAPLPVGPFEVPVE